MPEHGPLISTIVVGLVLAFAFGVVAHRFRISPLVGYLLAGIAIGPFTPGFVADQHLANQLAEIGVILLMFGVGLHFSLEDLLSVRAIALPGAIVQIVSATLLGMGLAWLMGWGPGAGVIFGLALSVASTVVLLRALQQRRLIETERGRIAVGWLIVEDLAMILALVLLPAIAGFAGAADDANTLLTTVTLTIGKVAAFLALMIIVGKKLLPALLHYVAHTGSRELFRLAVLSIALGAAFVASELFDVSFALGAFFAGMMMSESRLSQQAASESLPLRDAFAVLFFVSVGMLFDPSILIEQPLALIATLLIILVGKSVAAFLIVRLFGHPTTTALTVSVSLAQIGEFSFILAGLGVSLAMLPEDARDLILAGALISIVLNPLLFALVDRFGVHARPIARQEPSRPAEPPEPAPAREAIAPIELSNHVVLVGHGRTGRLITQALGDKHPLLVIEDDTSLASELRKHGIEVIQGNAADPEIIGAANLGEARYLLVAIPDAFEGGQVVEQARAINAELPIIARSHSTEESDHLLKHGATSVVMDEREVAKSMAAHVRPGRPATAHAAGTSHSPEKVPES